MAECVILPPATVAVDPNGYSYDPATHEVCGTATRDNTTDESASFRVENASEVTFTGSGGTNSNQLGRWVEMTNVIADREKVLLVDDADSTKVRTAKTFAIDTNDTTPTGSTGWNVDTSTTGGGTVVDNVMAPSRTPRPRGSWGRTRSRTGSPVPTASRSRRR